MSAVAQEPANILVTQRNIPLLVIPTYNRSAKLRRVLDWYAGEHLNARIVVLDASSDPAHRSANADTARVFAHFVTRIETLGQDNIVRRLLTFLETVDDEVIAIGNDEDAFLAEFLDRAFAFLRAHPDYSVATGRYITTARPLLGLRRISYWTDSFLGLDVDEADPALRVVNFQRLNSGGVPPLYWSVRRRSVFIESCRRALTLRLSSAHELVDQITACVLGKIRIDAAPMLLRDESKVQNVGPRDRDAGRLYIDEADLTGIEEIFRSAWGTDVAAAVRTVTSWYRPKSSGESYCTRQLSRAYCRFQPVSMVDGESRLMRALRSLIRGCCTFGILLSQLFACLYFARYMARSGRKARFWKMTRAIAVQKMQ